MMDRVTIRNESDKAARRAARQHLEPYVVFDKAEVDRMTSFPFPFLGDYVPKGWEKVNELFCDSSGFGRDSEGALSVGQLQSELLKRLEAKDTFGYAIVEAGQFQAYVGVYRKVTVKAAKPKVDKTDVWPKAEGSA